MDYRQKYIFRGKMCLLVLLQWMLLFFFSISLSWAGSRNTIAVPHTRIDVLYTVHAADATLQRMGGDYFFTLHRVFHTIGHRTNYPIVKNDTEDIGIFLDSWKKIKNTPVGADVTGVMVDNKSIGHMQFYAIVWLSEPSYNERKNEIRFRLTFIDPLFYAVPTSGLLTMHSPVIFVDGKRLM